MIPKSAENRVLYAREARENFHFFKMLKKGHQKIKNPENAENGPPAVHFEIIRVQASPPRILKSSTKKKTMGCQRFLSAQMTPKDS